MVDQIYIRFRAQVSSAHQVCSLGVFILDDLGCRAQIILLKGGLLPQLAPEGLRQLHGVELWLVEGEPLRVVCVRLF